MTMPAVLAAIQQLRLTYCIVKLEEIMRGSYGNAPDSFRLGNHTKNSVEEQIDHIFCNLVITENL